LNFRTWALWLLGYPDAALEDADQAHAQADEVGLASTLMPALNNLLLTRIFCGEYVKAQAEAEKLCRVANEKAASYWKSCGKLHQGGLRALTGNPSDAIQIITSGMTAYRSTGSTLWTPLRLSYLAMAYAALGRFGDAWDCVREALNTIDKTKEKWFEAEANRVAGEIALMSPEQDFVKVQEYFERALAVAREQQAKSWELRAAMSMARLWRDQGKRQQAHELLAPVYGWFTEGFDTLDLKEAKTLLSELSS
jgi:predicted ATPase